MSAILEASCSLSNSIRSAFPFSVDKLPLYGPEGLRSPHYGLFRDDTGECVGTACKRTYVPHNIDDVCALSEAAASAFPGGSVAHCLFRDGHYVTVQPSAEYRRAIFGQHDNIFPRLIIRAGYDGRAFRATLGYYRDACDNLAMIRSAGRAVSANIRHTHHLRDRLDDLQRTFRALAAGWDGVAETARQLDARTVDLAEFVRTVYPMDADASRRTRDAFHRRTESIVRRIYRERVHTGREHNGFPYRDASATAWEAFNGVQGYIQHEQNRHGRPNAITRAIIALDDPAVERALELALSA